MSEPAINNEQCRVFVKDPTGIAWHLFTLSQSNVDGSIYFFSPEFDRYEWLAFIVEDGKAVPHKIKQGKDGKLSFHGSGQVHARSANEPPRIVAKGHFLLKPKTKEISLRHLFTVMPKQPQALAKSPALARKSDQLMASAKPLRPFFTIAFAIPRQATNIKFLSSMHVDEMEEIPGSFLGFHMFPLIHHNVLLIFYYTTNMETWPTSNLLQFLDGVIVPVFKGRPGKMIESGFVMPEYKLEGNTLAITLNMSGLPDQPLPPGLTSET